MGDLSIDEDSFLTERAVVEHEVEGQRQDGPYDRLIDEAVPRAVFGEHPYAQPVGGSIADLDAATLEDVRAFHAAYYRPDNAVLVVVGHFQPRQLDAWVDRYFGRIARPAGAIPRSPKAAARSVHPRVDAVTPERLAPAVILAFSGPPATATADAAALKVLRTILAKGEGSRAFDSLVERRRLATDVFSAVDLRQDGGLVYLGAVMAPGRSVAQGEAALRARIAELRDRPVGEAELQAAKNQLLLKALQGRETIDGRAAELGLAATVEGDAARADADLAAMLSVTPGDVRRAANAYLLQPGRVTLRRRRGAGPAEAAPVLARKGAPKTMALAPAADRRSSDEPLASGAAAFAPLPRPVVRTLPNGLTVVVARTAAQPLATALLTVKSGSACDPPGKGGLSELTLAMTGAARDRRRQLGTRLNRLGLSPIKEIDQDALALGFTGLSANLGHGLALLGDAVRRPRFDWAELGRIRSRLSDEHSGDEDLASRTDEAVEALAFGRDGRAAEQADAEDLDRITPGDIRRHHARLLRPDNAVLVLTGDVAPESAFALAQQIFGGWSKPAAAPLRPFTRSRTPKGRAVLIDAPAAGDAEVAIASVTVGRSDPTRLAVELVNTALGGSYTARLSQEIRIRRGLTYDVSSEIADHGRAGLFSARAMTQDETAAEVAGLMLDELDSLAQSGAPGRELAVSKAKLVADFRRSAETSEDLADMLSLEASEGGSLAEFADYPARIESVTPAAFRTAATNLADRRKLSLLVIGDARKVLPALKRRLPRLQVVDDQLNVASSTTPRPRRPG